ncbi:magnesium chelatase subunit D [Hwanghaeella sp. 1Z406]|uniref:magnesium chelatase subunit D n=1 Tax=Hwanghaeella sp. 1Z406 TaxID=3402811 RepID=UPI003B66E9FD|tara:strand:+ start:33111 stop:34931 length:1821 start_codon:yes stop_codon:yes gene_type:complete
MTGLALDIAFRAPALPDDACRAALLFAIDPFGLGGVCLTSRAGPQREAWLTFLRARLPPDMPERRLPNAIADDRLLGGLDLSATLSSGKPIVQRGLLADVDGGLLIIPMAERLDQGTAAKLCATLDQGEVRLERDGLTACHPTRFGTILLDERTEDEEPPPTGLCDRLAFLVALDPTQQGDPTMFEAADRDAILLAREILPGVEIAPEYLDAICGTTLAYGVASARAALLTLRAARAAAALEGRSQVTQDDVALAARLVIGPRATQMPAPPEEPEAEPEEAEQPKPPPNDLPEDPQDERDAPQDPLDPSALQEMMIEATRASLPANLLASLASELGRGKSGQGGRNGQTQMGDRRGRPIGTRRGIPKPGQRLNVLETLRAAAPWQPLRRHQRANDAKSGTVPRMEIRRDDFRITRYKQNAETVTIFVVDASGSAAVNRLAEAKGAVELLLADCYIRRDSVALITFSGRLTEVALPPTRSLVMAKRRLTGLPGGGGTPMAAAIDMAADLALAIRRKGQTPTLVFMTDGKANLTREGKGDRAQAGQEAMTAARQLAASGIGTLMVDISPRPSTPARELAAAMRAKYLPLPFADPAKLSNAVKGATDHV